MVTRDEARWDLIEATKKYVEAREEVKAIEVQPEDLVEGKDLLQVISPLTLPEVWQRLERFDRAWTRYRRAWESFLHFAGA